MNWVYLALEIGATAFFLGALIAAARRGRLPALELVSAAAFGLLLEEGDQLIFLTYHYNDAWVLVLDRAPLVIGLSWALIIAGAMRLTDALGVRRRYAPVVDAVLAISLDLAFDAIAIRMGLWTWRGIAPTDGWFGVPYGNFYAWLFVTLGFSLLTRWLRDGARGRPAREWLQLLVPLPAFALLLTGLIPFIAVKPLIDDAPGGGGIPFLVTLAGFVLISGWAVFGPDRAAPNGERMAIVDLRLAGLTRVAIHCYFLGALLVMGLATQLPVLLGVALLLLGAEVPLSWLVARRHERDLRSHAAQPMELGSPEPAG
ncbi:MAG TPA: carotenoid biosynthesis protein [Candidatus Limnocylindria bacterium]|nr:carotenoid biosynthesis protein [Candidatus Limnocylindria bacterium]